MAIDKKEGLNKVIANYFESNGYTVTGYPKKPTLGYYNVKNCNGIIYEICADDTLNCVLNKQGITMLESFLLISQDQEH